MFNILIFLFKNYSIRLFHIFISLKDLDFFNELQLNMNSLVKKKTNQLNPIQHIFPLLLISLKYITQIKYTFLML